MAKHGTSGHSSKIKNKNQGTHKMVPQALGFKSMLPGAWMVLE